MAADHQSDYGERFEKPQIVILSIVVIALTLGAFGLNVVFHDPCDPTYYTYCGPTEEGHH